VTTVVLKYLLQGTGP